MQTHFRNRVYALRLALCVTAGALSVACGIDKATAPALTGPSEFGLSVTMSANPDHLPRDGASQSTVTLTVRDENGRPLARTQRFALGFVGTPPSGVTLSQSEL